jgi:flavin-binding protein dodecin
VKAAESGKLRPRATCATDCDPAVLEETTVSNLRETIMSVVKFLELSAQSARGYEDAVRQAVERAARTIRNIRSVWLNEFEAVVDPAARAKNSPHGSIAADLHSRARRERLLLSRFKEQKR